MNSLRLLDCTLRDGGYYNNWDFDDEIINMYLDSIAKSNIDYIELGFRNFPKKGFLGAFAYTTEDYLTLLNLPDGPEYGVMVDAKTILSSRLKIDDAVKLLFVPRKKSKLSFVRVAAHFHEVEKTEKIVKTLKSLGYTVCLNLMQSGGKDDYEIKEKASIISSWNSLNILYFADSLGNMNEKEVIRIIGNIREYWNGPLGIHTHNNMSKGLDNSITAIENSVTWVDSTITGMGRGAGNTQTENLLAYLSRYKLKFDAKPVYELVIRYFEAMQKEYGWGSNLLYFLGAQNDVHPTYIQNLLSNTHYGTDEIIGAIDYLSNLSGTNTYNGSILNTALNFCNTKGLPSGSDKVKGLFNNKNIFILTNAPSTKKYLRAIELYIRHFKPIVISINICESVPSNLIDYYIISHNSRILSDLNKYKLIDKPIILPKHRFTSKELKILESVYLIDYGLEIKENNFVKHGTYTTIPYDITVAYLLGILMESKVNQIDIVGLDGYNQNDIRQQEMISLLNLYKNANPEVDITCLTPTPYPITKGSIYAYT